MVDCGREYPSLFSIEKMKTIFPTKNENELS
jgi:hypothetical protein